MRIRTKLAISAAAGVAALLTQGATPAFAWSGSSISSSSGQAYVRAQPNTNSAILGIAPNGRLVNMLCWTDAQWAYGNYWTNRWYYATVQSLGYNNWTGYVSASLVAHPTTVPHC